MFDTIKSREPGYAFLSSSNFSYQIDQNHGYHSLFSRSYFVWVMNFILMRHGETIVFIEYHSANVGGLLAMTSSKCFGEGYGKMVEG